MKRYVFISNSTKPDKKEYESLEDVRLTNVSRPCLKIAKEMGYNVILGVNRKYPKKLRCSEMDISFYNSHTFRSIFAFKDNYIAYKNLCTLLKEGNVEVIHCNTPIGGFIGRICGRKYKVPKVIYTAHGFHFYKGAPLLYNTVIKWIEFFLAHWTDVVITMNEEDYHNAKKMKLRDNGKVYKVNGVGINLEEYRHINANKIQKRKELNLNNDDFVCIAMGDLVKRKNYQMAIKAISQCNNEKIHYLICGVGPELNNLQKLSEDLGVDKQIHFLGYRTDIKELLSISDCFLFTSLQEGLPRSLMEAMACGLPCIVSNIRGNSELIKEKVVLCEVNNVEEYSNALCRIINDLSFKSKLISNNKERIKQYDINTIYNQLFEIYAREVKSNI